MCVIQYLYLHIYVPWTIPRLYMMLISTRICTWDSSSSLYNIWSLHQVYNTWCFYTWYVNWFVYLPDKVPCFYIYLIKFNVSLCTGYSILCLNIPGTVHCLYIYQVHFFVSIYSGYSTWFLCALLTAPSTGRFRKCS